MKILEFTCSHVSCQAHNIQRLDQIPDMTGYRHIGDNLYLLLPTWVKNDEQGQPVKGRTYCVECLRPNDFIISC
jgi:hypothetical protein